MKKNKFGAERYRLVLFGTEVQQRLRGSRYKTLTTLINEDVSLAGLDIDWHLFEIDVPSMNVEPVMVQDFQPTYAYA